MDYLDLKTSRKRLEQLCRKVQAIRERSEEIRLQAHQSRRTSDAKLRECQTRWKLRIRLEIKYPLQALARRFGLGCL